MNSSQNEAIFVSTETSFKTTEVMQCFAIIAYSLIHYATIFKTFGIEEIREFLCTLQAHYVFCMHLWDVIIHIWSYFKYPSTIKSASISLHFHFFIF